MNYTLGIPVRQDAADMVALQLKRSLAAVAIGTQDDPNTIDEVQPSKRYAVYCNQATDDAILTALAKAKSTNTPRVFWYHDGERWNTELAAKYKRKGLFALIQAYRRKGESDVDFKARMKAEYQRVIGQGWDALIVLGVSRRQRAIDPPIYDLTIKDVCHGVILFSEVAMNLDISDVIIFAENRKDVPSEVLPYLEALFKNVQVLANLPTLVWTKPPDPEDDMPYQKFVIDPGKSLKQSQSFIKYVNDVGQRVGPILGVPTSPPAGDTGFTPAGQHVNECYDIWDEAMISIKIDGGTIPSANIMSQITVDRKQRGLSNDAIKASLIHEVPLR